MPELAMTRLHLGHSLSLGADGWGPGTASSSAHAPCVLHCHIASIVDSRKYGSKERSGG